MSAFAKDIDDWSGYGTRLLGLQAVDRKRATLALRMDDRKQRLIVTRRGARASRLRLGGGMPHLDRLGAHLESTGSTWRRASRGLADERMCRFIGHNDPSATGWSSSTAPRRR